jgi:hypothetical protein
MVNRSDMEDWKSQGEEYVVCARNHGRRVAEENIEASWMIGEC